MRTRITILALAALALAAPASAQQLFDFLGQANIPAMVGGTLDMASVVREPASPATTPIPLDFDNYEYTLVVTGVTLDVDAFTQAYSGGTVTIYEDAGTTADYALPGTFTDGTAILVGTFTVLNRTIFPGDIGTANGYVDWTGGTRLDDIAPEDQDQWAFLTGIDLDPGVVEPGYDERWDGKLEPSDIIVDTEDTSWGALKSMMR